VPRTIQIKQAEGLKKGKEPVRHRRQAGSGVDFEEASILAIERGGFTANREQTILRRRKLAPGILSISSSLHGLTGYGLMNPVSNFREMSI
jgi:hypothetical protein